MTVRCDDAVEPVVIELQQLAVLNRGADDVVHVLGANQPWGELTVSSSRRARFWNATVVAISGGRWRLGRRSLATDARLAADLQGAPAMLTILIILLVLALLGGGLGHSRFGYAGWSPAGVLILVVLVLMVTGTRF